MSITEYIKYHGDTVATNSTVVYNRLSLAIDRTLESTNTQPYLTTKEVYNLIQSLKKITKILENQLYYLKEKQL